MANYNNTNSLGNRLVLFPQGRIPFVPTTQEMRDHPIFNMPTHTYASESNPQPLLPKNYFRFPGNTSCASSASEWDESSNGMNSYFETVNRIKASQTQTQSAEVKKSGKKSSLVAAHYSSSDEDDDNDTNDADVIARLRKKAKQLKELGGDVPKEIRSVLDSFKSNSEIMADLVREMPDNEDEIAVADMDIDNTEPYPYSKPTPPKPLFTSVSSANRTVSNAAKQVSHSSNSTQKKTPTTFQKIKLSARAQELIKNCILTAKARNTNFVETADGLKPADEVRKPISDMTLKQENNDPIDPISALSEINCSAIPIDKNTNQERNILEVKKEVKTESVEPPCNETSSKEDMFNFQSTSFVPNKKRTKPSSTNSNLDDVGSSRSASLVSKCDEFVQSVITSESSSSCKKSKNTTTQEEKRKVSRDHNTSETVPVLNEENSLRDSCDLIMEKLKFLIAGKSPSRVQLLAIQTETLVDAWRAKALSSDYLKEWFKGAQVHLKSIEETAAPQGWLCEWDRNFSRYYYRQKCTGKIQWDYPEGASSHRSKIPPPPNISDTIGLQPLMPPPPPIISIQESRKNRSDSDRKKNTCTVDQFSPSSSFTIKIEQPPLPPPPSSPPPPPPLPPSVKIENEDISLNENQFPVQMKMERAQSPTFLPATFVIKDELPLDIPYEEPLAQMNRSGTVNENELNSFYSEVASIEATCPISVKDEKIEIKEEKNDGIEYIYPQPLPPEEQAPSSSKSKQKCDDNQKKKKSKKVKLDSSLSLKKKDLPTLLDRWTKQRADY